MHVALKSLLAFTSIPVLIAGCGGSSGGGSTTGGGGDTSTTVIFTITGGTPSALAARIGSGSFSVETLTAGKLTLTIPSGTTNFAVAYVCNQGASQSVFEASTADGASYTLNCPELPSPPQTGTLTGSVDGSAIPGVNLFDIETFNGSSGKAFWSYTVPSTNFSFSAPAGNDRVGVLGYNYQINGTFFEQSLIAVKDFPSQAVPGALNGGNAVILGAADKTTAEPITYNNVPSGFISPQTYVVYILGSGGEYTLTSNTGSSYPAVPAGAAENGDYYEFLAGTGDGVSSLVSSDVGVGSSGPVTITFPAARSYAGPTPAALPTFDFTYSGFSGKTDVMDSGLITWWIGSPAKEYSYSFSATANAMDGSTSMTLPDLSGITGFLAPPASNQQVSWQATISHSSNGYSQSFTPGSTISAVTNYGTFKVP